MKSAFSYLKNYPFIDVIEGKEWEKIKLANNYHIADNEAVAWEIIKRIIPGAAWKKDEAASKGAGYAVYYPTIDGVQFVNIWISDLNCRLELNLPNGRSFNIPIETREPEEKEVEEKEIEEMEKMEITKEEKIALNVDNIDKALSDYNRRTTDKIEWGADFVDTLSRDNYEAKKDLRELFRKSPAWNEELDAIVINGNRTHEPDYNKIYDLWFALIPEEAEAGYSQKYNHTAIKNFFTTPEGAKNPENISEIEKVIGAKVREGQKRSKTLRKVLQALGLGERVNTRVFSEIADELNSKTIPFKLYASLNPAHFLTMSNPKDDTRGEALTSCHSLNSSYSYKQGCSGYARDETSFIVFTADPKNPETLNNRKKTRQIFAYQGGVLLQSRLYSSETGESYGGADGAKYKEIKDLYRHLIQKEIADALGVRNAWRKDYYINDKGINENDRKNKFNITITAGDAYTGYKDWEFQDFGAIVSVLKDMEYIKRLEIGAGALCLKCGERYWNADDLYCENCDDEGFFCDCCEEHCHGESYVAYREGVAHTICDTCRDSYMWCEDCEELYHEDEVVYIEDKEIYVCKDCAERKYYYCEQCGKWYSAPTVSVYDEYGNITEMCGDCVDYYASYCEHCGAHFRYELVIEFEGEFLCRDCLEARKEDAEDEAA